MNRKIRKAREMDAAISGGIIRREAETPPSRRAIFIAVGEPTLAEAKKTLRKLMREDGYTPTKENLITLERRWWRREDVG